MIKFFNSNQEKPYLLFRRYYSKALRNKQQFIEAISISSFNKKKEEVDSRYVNLKFVANDEWTFFTNYNSKKSKDFESHNQISAIFHWDSINVQIRIKAVIEKTSKEVSDKYFINRSVDKNALAISSDQSNKIDSYQSVVKKYKKTLKNNDDFTIRPKYWGGFTFKPYTMEFWEGHPSRINKRILYENINDRWVESILEP